MQSGRVVAFLILFLGFQCIQASGQQVVATWTDASGNWTNPANWSTLTVPNNGGGTTYSVRITVPGAVVMNAGGTIDNLTLGTATTLSIIGGSLSLASGASSNNGSLGIEGSSVFGGASLLNNSGAHFTNNGSILLSLEGAALGNSGIFINNSEIKLIELTGLDNAGGGLFINSGTITAEASTLGNAGTFKNSGTISVTSIGDASNFSNSGTFNNSGTMSLSFGPNEAPNVFANSGTLNNGGTINLSYGCPAPFSCSSISNSGTINNSGALNITAFPGTPDFFANSGTLNDGGTINNAGTFVNSGGVRISTAGLFTTSTSYMQTAGRTTVDGTLTATNGAIVDIQGGTLGGKGTINGNVLMAGTMMPGDAPGTLTIFGNYEQTGTGIFKELMSPFAQAFLDVSGNVVLDPGALLDITLLGGFNPLGDTIGIMDFSTLSGRFANGSSFLDDGFLWDITYRQHEIDVTAVEAVPEPSSMLLLSLGFIALGTIVKRKKMAK